MSLGIRESPEPLPLEVGQIGGFEARMLRSFHAVAEDWDEVCSALGPWEAKHLSSNDAGDAREQHPRWASALLSWGRALQRATQQAEFPQNALAAAVTARS